MAAIIENQLSFKKFKEGVYIQQFGRKLKKNYLIHYDHLSYGYKYRIALINGTKEASLKAAYWLLFNEHSNEGMLHVMEKVSISEIGFKVPLTYQFNNAYNCINFKFIKLRDVLRIPSRTIA